MGSGSCLSFLKQILSVSCTSRPMLGARKSLETRQAGSFPSKTLHSPWLLARVIYFLLLSLCLPRGNWISHTYFKTFSASTFYSGFSFSAPFSGTKKWMFNLARVILFCFLLFFNHCRGQHRMNTKPALRPCQLGPSYEIIPEIISLRLKKVTKCRLLFSISSPSPNCFSHKFEVYFLVAQTLSGNQSFSWSVVGSRAQLGLSRESEQAIVCMLEFLLT